MVLVLAKPLPIVEPIPIPDTICSAGLILIQDVGYGARFVVANRETVYEVGIDQLVVQGKIVLPWNVIWPGICQAMRFMTDRPMTVGSKLLRVVG